MLTSSRSILPYGMLLTTIFQHFGTDLDSESDVRMSKPSDYIDNAYITHLSYEHDGCHWVEKTAHASIVVDVETDEEAEMDIPPPLPTTSHSPHSPPPHGTTSSSNHPEWYQNLSQRIDTFSLDLQALSDRFGVIES